MGTKPSSDISYRFEWRVRSVRDEEIRPVAEEVARRGRRNEDLGDRAEKWRRFWTGLNYLLGAPAAVLAAVSGYVGLEDPKNNVLAGSLALVSAGLGGLLAFLNPTVRAAAATARANAYWQISHKARLLLIAELPRADAARAGELLAELQASELATMSSAPPSG